MPSKPNVPNQLELCWSVSYMGLITHIDPFSSNQGPKRAFLGPNPYQRAPFLVRSCFDRNIGMWGVQIVATEFSDVFRQLQLILNHPDGEIDQ